MKSCKKYSQIDIYWNFAQTVFFASLSPLVRMPLSKTDLNQTVQHPDKVEFPPPDKPVMTKISPARTWNEALFIPVSFKLSFLLFPSFKSFKASCGFFPKTFVTSLSSIFTLLIFSPLWNGTVATLHFHQSGWHDHGKTAKHPEHVKNLLKLPDRCQSFVLILERQSSPFPQNLSIKKWGVTFQKRIGSKTFRILEVYGEHSGSNGGSSRLPEQKEDLLVVHILITLYIIAFLSFS